MSTVELEPRPDLPDPRRHAWRADLAAENLRGRVEVDRFVPGEPAHLMRPSVPMRRRPDVTAAFENEILFGEDLLVYDRAGGWAWVQLARDGYVGYIPDDVLARGVLVATHRVQALGTFVYPAPDIKVPPIMTLSLNARLAVTRIDDRFAELATGGFVVARHIAEAGRPVRDFVEVAERFIGVPYLWGGRTRLGLDCSGLVQLALEAAGQDAPRDSDMQQAEIGASVLVPESLEGLQRGDLVFWPRHVGIMVDAFMLLHANAHHMAVAVEPLEVAARRIARGGSAIAAIRRPAGSGGEA